MNEKQLIYRIALGMIPGVGSITAKKLVEHTGSLEAIFREQPQNLKKIPSVGDFRTKHICDQTLLSRAEKELEYILKRGIRCLFYQDPDYPERLRSCHDAPVVLYVKGPVDLNAEKIISVIGTRRPSESGLNHCRKIIKTMASVHPDVLVVSGLAYGIDICAHRTALNHQLATAAVLGHGFRHIYPPAHSKTARRIQEEGALLTEFPAETKPERNNFIRRNRIIAGLSEATLVVQSPDKGGALITAGMANSYNREVFAIPGRPEDRQSAGCNFLIKSHRASLIEQFSDIQYMLGWMTRQAPAAGIQKALFSRLNSEEQKIMDILHDGEPHNIDMISLKSRIPVNRVSTILLKLEFSELVYCLPGNRYRIIS